jgi:phospholipid-binding lipoprotein MlaA
MKGQGTMKNRLNIILFIFGLALFLTSGCAHNRASTTSPANKTIDSATASSDQNLSLSAKSIPSLAEEEEDLLDELEEEYEDNSTRISDPLVSWNRAMFHFNDKLYLWALKPVAKGYRAVTPMLFRTGVRNFFNNLMAPIRFVNCLLQFKGIAATNEFARFVVNSTVGVLGFGDIASNNPGLLPPPKEDFGQTLATYKIGSGPYIVWPFFGPSTLRDSIGMVGDYFLNPISYIEPAESEFGETLFEIINTTTFYI